MPRFCLGFTFDPAIAVLEVMGCCAVIMWQLDLADTDLQRWGYTKDITNRG